MNKDLNTILKTQDLDGLTNIIQDGAELKEIILVDFLVDILNNKEEVNLKFFNVLIENGVNINTVLKKSKISSFMLMAHVGSVELINLLIQKKVDIHVRDINNMNAFHWAVAGGKMDIVEYLIDNDANIYEKAKFEIEEEEDDENDDLIIKKIEVSSFAFAFNKYNPKVIKLLIEKGFDVNENVLKNNGIFDAINKNNYYCLENRSVEHAVSNNDLDLLNILIQNGANRFHVDDCIAACEKLNLDMIKVLVENGVKINDTDEIGWRSPLQTVCKHHFDNIYSEKKSENQYNILKYLISHGADVNLDNPLLDYCKHSSGRYGIEQIDKTIIKLFIDNGVDVNSSYRNGKSLLMEICNHKSNGFEIAQMLVDNGVNIDYKDINGNTALMLIEEHEDNLSCEHTKNNGTEVEEKYNLELQSNKILELLLDNGAKIDERNNVGMTALMKYAYEGNEILTKILLERGADITLKSEMTAFTLASNNEIKKIIQDTQNNNPQKLVKLLSNFTIDKPIKYTTHLWDFGELKNEYGSFNGYMEAVKKQFLSMKEDLEDISSNLYKKIYTFLLETNPDSTYSWCSKANINVGWSSLDGLKEHCDSGKNAFDFELKEYIVVKKGLDKETVTTFGGVINLFKQEIEMRIDSKNLETIFNDIEKSLSDDEFKFDIAKSKLQRQFYTDTKSFNSAVKKIFVEIKKRIENTNIELTTKELDDRSLEIRIVQVDSKSSKDVSILLNEVDDGDFADIKELLSNLCDWSVESSCEDGNFRINYLHSNNVKQIVELEKKPKGFTHILRFYR